MRISDYLNSSKITCLVIIVMFLLVPFTSAQFSGNIEDTGASIAVIVDSYKPTVLTSNLIAEQNTPVFVFLKGSTLGSLLFGQDSPQQAPFYGIPRIKNIVVRPTERDRFISNIVYRPPVNKQYIVDDNGFVSLGNLIVYIKKTPKEDQIPSTIDLEMIAKIYFDLESGLGRFGSQDLELKENANEQEWKNNVDGDFWDKLGYLRASDIKGDSVDIKVYDGSLRQIGTVTLSQRNPVSSPITLRTNIRLFDKFRVKLEKIVGPEISARIEIQENGITKIRTLRKGMRILPGSEWVVDNINVFRDEKENILEQVVIKNLYGTEDKGEERVLQKIFGKFEAPEFIVEPIDIKNLEDRIKVYEPYIREASSAYNVDKELIMAVIAQESAGVYYRISNAGAVGLMQLMPGTANDIDEGLQFGSSSGESVQFPEIYKIDEFLKNQDSESYVSSYVSELRNIQRDLGSIKDPLTYKNELVKYDSRFDPRTNILGGTLYLKWLSQQSYIDNEEKLIAAYNAGPGNVQKYNGIPPFEETQDYVSRVLSYKNRFEASATLATTTETTLKEPQVTKKAEEATDPCDKANIVSDEELSKSFDSMDYYCTAINEYKTLIEQTTNNELIGQSYCDIGSVYEKLQRYDLALENYEKAKLKVSQCSIGKDIRDVDKIIAEVKERYNLEIKYADVVLDDNTYLRLEDVNEVEEDEQPFAIIKVGSNAPEEFRTTGKNTLISEGKDGDGNVFDWKIESIDENSVTIVQVYRDTRRGTRQILTLGNPKAVEVDLGADTSINVEVTKIDTKKRALVTVLPGTGNEVSESEFTIHIPVEKRLFKLTPEQIDSQISTTRDLIEKLDNVINTLDNVVRAWRIGCIGTFGFLVIKNSFFNRESLLARKFAMRGPDGETGYFKTCEDAVKVGTYKNVDQCLLDKKDEINTAISEQESILKNVKNKIDDIGDITNNDGRTRFVSELENKLNDDQVQKLVESGDLGNGDVERLVYLKENNDEQFNKEINELQKRAEFLQNKENALSSITDETERTIASINYEYSSSPKTISTWNVDEDKVALNQLSKVNEDGKIYDVGQVVIEKNDQNNLGKAYTYVKQDTNLEKVYLDKVLKEGSTDQLILSGRPVYKDQEGNFYRTLLCEGDNCLASDYATDPRIYYLDGKPYLIPVKGNYFKDADYLRVSEYDGNGFGTSFELWNVGPDGKIDYKERVKDDQFKYTIDKREASIITQRQQDLNKALEAFKLAVSKSESAKIFGKEYLIDKYSPESNKLQCQDVMSVEDCNLLFNVCDPVMCPSSRFNFGGRWQVSSVASTGLIGSLFLGSKTNNNPISRVCYTGVLAGLQNIRSYLQGYESCLQTAKIKGETVGICDRIQSLFICETAWREAIAAGKLVGSVTGLIPDVKESSSGGSEYLNFKSSLQNSADSFKFFTKEYATSAFGAYQGRSTQEVGSEICKAAIFGRGPGIGKFFDQVAQPESPPQFTAFFDEYPILEIVERSGVESMSRYSLYYHIYAGENRDVSYSIYLLHPKGGSPLYVTENPNVALRQRVYLKKGQFADKNLDFTAESGYNEICIEINGVQQCGFGKVTSAYSLNKYVGDYLAEKEALKNIKTADECVPDYPSIGTSLGQITLPGKYGLTQTGIIRTCSLTIPGDSSRWSAVGTCGKDSQGRNLGTCWMDLQSISIENIKDIETREKVLQELEKKKIEIVQVLSDQDSKDLYIRLGIEFYNVQASLNKQDIINLIPRFRNLRDFSTNLEVIDKSQYAIARLYEILGDSVNKKETKEQDTPKIGTDTKTNTKDQTEKVETKFCSDCGAGLFNFFCESRECHEISEICYFVDDGFDTKNNIGTCYSCSSAKSCSGFNSDYTNIYSGAAWGSKACENSVCLSMANNGNGLSCVYDPGAKKCVNKPDYEAILDLLTEDQIEKLSTYTTINARLSPTNQDPRNIEEVIQDVGDLNSMFYNVCEPDVTNLNTITGQATNEICISELPEDKNRGYASWYGPGFDGRRTANGETFDMEELTAAMLEIPFNTNVKVINLKNSKSIIVRINDRGPYKWDSKLGKFVEHPNRIIDLSKAAAEELDMIDDGVVLVKLELA